MKKILGPVLGVLVLLGVGAAIYFSASEQSQFRNMVEVKGLIGSEKQVFFDDERVKKRLAELGLKVNYRKAGSRQIATSFNLGEFDFAFPAGLPAAEKIKRQYKYAKSYSPFFSPIAIASWKPLAEILVKNGIAKKDGEIYKLDMQKYLQAFKQKTRWKDLKDNKVFPVSKDILINSTDIRKSNSAAMYLSLASYVLNNNEVVQNQQQINNIFSEVSDLFVRQGFVQSSSAAPFEDYLIMGMGKAPMVIIYEQQFISKAAAADGSMSEDMILMYPEPTIFSKHTLVGLSDGGQRLGEVLSNDDELQKLEIEHGLRNSNIAYFRDFTQKHNIKIPPNFVNVVESPSYEMVEAMISGIEAKY